MKGLRTIPVALGIARDVRELAPEAWLINFTNPAGMITEALLRHGHPKTIGVCNGPIGMEMSLAKRLGIDRRELTLDYVGLNHLGWVRGATVGGSNVWPELFGGLVADGRARGELGGFEPSLIELLGMLPSSYLHYYYHHRSTVAQARAAERTRGEEVQAIETELLKMYEDEHLCTKPKLLERRGGAYYSTLAVAIIAAIVNDKRELFIVNTRNRGAIPNMPADVVVEVPCIIGANGALPLPTAPLPPEIGGLVHAVKAYELLAVEAGTQGSRRAATLAMLAHPLVPDYEAAAEMLDVLLEANSPHLPQFGG
jgi:6-phospho-beta-glucosidase